MLQNFVSKSVSSPQMHTRWQHQIPCIPCLPPPPPHLQKWKFQLRTWLWNFEVDFWKSAANAPPPPHTPGNGNFSSGLDFEIFKLTSESWSPTPPAKIGILNFLFLAFLDSALKVGRQTPTPPLAPHLRKLEFWILHFWTQLKVDLLGDTILRKLIFCPSAVNV